MDRDTDLIVQYLRAEPLPDALGAMSGAVMAGVAKGRERRSLRRAAVAACLVAGLIGVWLGASQGNSPAPEAESLLAVPVSAPSRLLVA